MRCVVSWGVGSGASNCYFQTEQGTISSLNIGKCSLTFFIACMIARQVRDTAPSTLSKTCLRSLSLLVMLLLPSLSASLLLLLSRRLLLLLLAGLMAKNVIKNHHRFDVSAFYVHQIVSLDVVWSYRVNLVILLRR